MASPPCPKRSQLDYWFLESARCTVTLCPGSVLPRSARGNHSCGWHLFLPEQNPTSIKRSAKALKDLHKGSPDPKVMQELYSAIDYAQVPKWAWHRGTHRVAITLACHHTSHSVLGQTLLFYWQEFPLEQVSEVLFSQQTYPRQARAL